MERQFGSLGEIPFTVLRQPSRAGRTRTWRYAVHEVAGADSVPEAVGRDLDAVTLALRLVAVDGPPGVAVDPGEDLAALVRLADSRRAQSLFVGAAHWGWFVVETITDDVRRLSPGGALVSVDVALSLKGAPAPTAP